VTGRISLLSVTVKSLAAEVGASATHFLEAAVDDPTRMPCSTPNAIQAAGFHSAELVATLAGEPFYAAFEYSPAERYEIPMAAELTLPVVHMTKHFGVA
jgi:hypothetical protein